MELPTIDGENKAGTDGQRIGTMWTPAGERTFAVVADQLRPICQMGSVDDGHAMYLFNT